MRVAIYARYSSDLQDPRSIADQVSACRQRAEREGWTASADFSDAAISGAAIANRPGLQDLMRAAESGAFDVVVTESLDRLSRDIEDLAHIHKRLAYHGVRVSTLADGEVGTLHVGLRGIVGKLYLEDLAQKTRRGQVGRVRAGRIPGGRCFGYNVVPGDERGRRVINEPEAAVVKRIFAEFLAGNSPIAIATRLNAEGVPGPRGGLWGASTINGSRKRQNGILSNSLYVGRLTYNRQKFIKCPTTGKRQARANPRAEWITAEVPELRIINDETWEAVQTRRALASAAPLRQRRRPKRLLSGLLRCGCCGGSYIVRTRDYVACARRVNNGACDNNREPSMIEIEKRVLAALRQHLLAPEIVQTAVEEYRRERERLAREQARTRRQSERDLAETKRRIAQVIEAIETGAAHLDTLIPRLNALEEQRRTIEARMALSPAKEIVSLHPQAAKRYKEKVAEIHDALSRGDAASADAVGLVRDLITEIRVIPRGKGEPVALEIVGDLAALMATERDANSVTGSVVAGVGFEPTTFRL
jgi:site-specific DNA recombinase